MIGFGKNRNPTFLDCFAQTAILWSFCPSGILFAEENPEPVRHHRFFETFQHLSCNEGRENPRYPSPGGMIDFSARLRAGHGFLLTHKFIKIYLLFCLATQPNFSSTSIRLQHTMPYSVQLPWLPYFGYPLTSTAIWCPWSTKGNHPGPQLEGQGCIINTTYLDIITPYPNGIKAYPAWD